MNEENPCLSYVQRMEVNEEKGQIIIEESLINPREALLDRVISTVFDTRDELLRQGLIKLGWTPPDAAPEMEDF